MKAPTLRRKIALVALLLGAAGLPSANAILFDSTADVNFNTSAPGGTLINSGWQYEGQWIGFLGTPIAPNYFITAQHIGGTVGDAIIFNGQSFTTTAAFNDPNSDLRIWQVSGTFPSFAPLYTASDETGRDLVVFGRGTQRGAEVRDAGGNLHGWGWGAGDGVQRWGTNVVTRTVSFSNVPGQFLQSEFNHGASVNESDLSVGDSGGGLFVDDGTGWKLAAINYGVDSPYSASADGSNLFNADLFEQTGYFEQTGTNPVTYGPAAPTPGSFYSTRISSQAGWINSVVPEPSTPLLLLGGMALLGWRWLRASRFSTNPNRP